MNTLHPAVILLFCRAVGAVAARFGQVQVVAEMIAGVLLGPSLFGLLLPELQAWLFPWDKSQTVQVDGTLRWSCTALE